MLWSLGRIPLRDSYNVIPNSTDSVSNFISCKSSTFRLYIHPHPEKYIAKSDRPTTPPLILGRPIWQSASYI